MKRRLIIDGNNLVHRVYWVSKNQPNFNEMFHIHLFLSSVKNYINHYKPDVTYCAWDEKEDYNVNKRKDILTEYKGTRDKERNKEVHSRNSIIKEMLELLGIRSVLSQSYEADDTMAVICNEYKDDRKIIVTVDKDLCQLIDKNTVVYDPIKKYEYNESNFESKLGYTKENFVKFKALNGDKSDNIPGLKGFGPVKIAKYFNGEYQMTNEEQLLFEKNLTLVDLSLTLNDEAEVEYVRNQLNKDVSVQFDLFMEKCKEYDFHQIIKNKDDWYENFALVSKLSEMFSFLQ